MNQKDELEGLLPPSNEQDAARMTRRQKVIERGLFFVVWCAFNFIIACVAQYAFDIPPYGWPLFNEKVTPNLKPDPDAQADFDWAKVPTLPDLQYTSCYGSFQCARLEVPLDYWNGTNYGNVSLAVIKLPAVVPITDPRYGGPILLNPGGPGGSGVFMAIHSAPTLQSLLDARQDAGSTARFFDILGFDPRGISLSKPAVHCFSDPAHTASWGLRLAEQGTLTSSDAAFGRLWSMFSAVGQTCSRVPDDNISKFVSTASVAHDMISIVDAHGQWREREAARLSGNRQVVESLRYRPYQEKLQYWGFSYGTYLGATFASLFPDRVGRLVLDGVVDAEDYTANDWYDNLFDTEKAFDSFFYHCHRVGYPTCPLAVPGGSVEGVRDRVLNIIQNLHNNPFPVVSTILPTNPDVISWSDVRNFIFVSLYAPILLFPSVAHLLVGLELGNSEYLREVMALNHFLECDCAPHGERAMPAGDPLAPFSILCGDADLQTHMNKTAFSAYTDSLQDLSPSFGDIWAQIKLSCVRYNLRPHYRYPGPWKTSTAHGILWVGNTADPVTPLSSARKMADGFPGSVVLTQDSPGHCSLAAFSACTVEYIQEYFQTGELPPPGTICQPDVIPFGPGPTDVRVSAEVQASVDKHERLAKGWLAAGGGLMREPLTGRFDTNALA